MSNPFNQERYRGEHELGRAYMDIRKAIENLSDIKLVADNIKNLRSGNIELRSEGSVLQWKYVNSTDWFDLVDLQVLVEEYDQKFTQINQTLQNLNTQLDTLNGIVSGHTNTLSDLDQRVENTEEFDSRISLLESSIADLISRVETLETNEGDE